MRVRESLSTMRCDSAAERVCLCNRERGEEGKEQQRGKERDKNTVSEMSTAGQTGAFNYIPPCKSTQLILDLAVRTCYSTVLT